MTMTFPKEWIDNPLFIGYRSLDERMRDLGKRTLQTTDPVETFPPWDSYAMNDDQHRIDVAVAGYPKSHLSLELRDNVLTLHGDQPKANDKLTTFIHKGIAKRAFKLRWQLADNVVVEGASCRDGILSIALHSVVPEEKKPRSIEIGDSPA